MEELKNELHMNISRLNTSTIGDFSSKLLKLIKNKNLDNSNDKNNINNQEGEKSRKIQQIRKNQINLPIQTN